MILSRLAPASLHGAVLVRVAAFVAAAVSVVLIPATLASAAAGHASVSHAVAVAGTTAALTIVFTLAARSLDPLRR